ncbi:hypothetical protein SERLA73DRAFT_174951 [Serpula lacrymans var. lacrymans S7.3]|uniref:Signal recognition particle, SRP19 subunit n=2 Tax=Serpula lacrymans var. lacrymans TaxID=341189 RepID=F8PJQ2_SERL3|nr:uncharacterized protein SERLADRAFT_456704 [Serpula lacrymans var. lacrymans S7.9]EGO03462.1 hypothetical protein SERLA73DRAFT_174951 [Serpula lacrymans var. lacrymans S7.3]EGO29222.1 hypothetical protein SERLADRAFT_456704 [Serpula lacrymans var. lacrymans S7.9]
MSRKAAIVEEFDDDTDLALPSRPLPNTGTRGPLLEEIDYADDGDDDDEDEDSDEAPFLRGPTAGPASPSRPAASSDGMPSNTVTDITPYKKWTCIYPIYIDAKRSYGTGERRIPREKSVWWPLSKDIADASVRLGLRSLHEVNKAHPRDWENPGRVRVQWKKDGRLLNGAIKSKKQLLEMISFQIQRIKPDSIPIPPYTTASSRVTTPTPAKTVPSISKGKQPASKSKAGIPAAPLQKFGGGRKMPVPPEPHPPLASRVSPYSPALPSGVLIEAVKAGMNAQESGGGGAAPGGPAGGVQKGKRKVLRVRG